MAYVEKFRSDFYNLHGRFCRIRIESEGYSGPVIDIRTIAVEVTLNFKDPNTAIIGTGAKIVIAVNQDNFDTLEELLTSLEKQYRCTIVHGGTVVFQGYSICDLNERQLLPFAKMTLQFTDYLSRLENFFIPVLATISDNSTILDLLKGALLSINTTHPLYINSTLFETTMSATTSYSFLEQTYVENNVFYSDSVTYDNAYNVINRILLSFGAYLFSHGESWVIERQEDVAGLHDWTAFSPLRSTDVTGTAISVANRGQIYNKQVDDFKYKEESQIVAYNSGLQKLILNLKDSQLDSFVFNDYTKTMESSVALWPETGGLANRTWYKYSTISIIETGFAFKGMNTYVKYRGTGTGFSGHYLAYNFEVQFNPSMDKPITLSVSFKMSADADFSAVTTVYGRYAIRLDGGDYADWWLTMVTYENGMIGPRLTPPETLSGRQIPVDISSVRNEAWTINDEYNLGTPLSDVADEEPYTSIWEILGKPLKQKFTIFFFPMGITLPGWQEGSMVYSWVNYLGDISVTITDKDIPNKITYYVNRNFVKTEEFDIEFFDLYNVNFNNGLLTNSGQTKTNKWTSALASTEVKLIDIFAMHKFRNFCKTTHTLKATIICDRWLKPFSILTDNTILDDSGAVPDLILQAYTWDIVNGEYDIEAEEYTDEEITLAGMSGTVNLEDPTALDTIPENVTVYQQEFNGAIEVSWSAVTGATGYRVRRFPQWDEVSSSWLPFTKLIYDGTGLSFVDHIEDEGTMVHDTTVYYQVCAYNSNYNGPYSNNTTVQWYEYNPA